MIQKFAGPANINQLPMEMARNNLKSETLLSEMKNMNDAPLANCSGASNSPYRSAYLRAHIFNSPHGDDSQDKTR
jgi:uncharacterized protein YukE